MIIQVILILFAAALLFFMNFHRNSTKIKAYKKLAFLVFITTTIYFILFPNTLNSVASLVGVGRGADLLTYLLFFVFVFFVINVYNKFKQQQDYINKLGRKIAIIEAKEANRKSQ